MREDNCATFFSDPRYTRNILKAIGMPKHGREIKDIDDLGGLAFCSGYTNFYDNFEAEKESFHENFVKPGFVCFKKGRYSFDRQWLLTEAGKALFKAVKKFNIWDSNRK